jgi:hypothetical protein
MNCGNAILILQYNVALSNYKVMQGLARVIAVLAGVTGRLCACRETREAREFSSVCQWQQFLFRQTSRRLAQYLAQQKKSPYMVQLLLASDLLSKLSPFQQIIHHQG